MSSERDTICYPPPPPPPPPPVIPLLLNNSLQRAKKYMEERESQKVPEQELLEVRKRLWDREGTQDPPHISYYRYIQPVLQDGPTCGLVALCMASSCTSSPLSEEQLLQEARSRGFTNHGEMFSVDDMATLARDMLEKSCREVEVLSGGLGQDKEYVIQQLKSDSILLIPYDADANDAPCCRRGHKAHWAVVSGVIISATSQRTCHLLARQGKSRHLAVWSYEELQRSNENLIEMDPSRATDGRSYILPPGGVAAGLCGRAILLHDLGINPPPL